MPNRKKSGELKSDLIAFRDADLQKQIADLVAANPKTITKSQILRAAVMEKLERVGRGEGILLNSQPSRPTPNPPSKRAKKAKPVEVKPKKDSRSDDTSAMAGA